VFTTGQRHFAGRTSLAVKRPIRPVQSIVKTEPIAADEKQSRPNLMSLSARQERSASSVDTAQYSSSIAEHSASSINNEPNKFNSRTHEHSTRLNN
jgi:hypothetical protein